MLLFVFLPFRFTKKLLIHQNVNEYLKAGEERNIGKTTINYITILDTLTDTGNGVVKSFAENNV